MSFTECGIDPAEGTRVDLIRIEHEGGGSGELWVPLDYLPELQMNGWCFDRKPIKVIVLPKGTSMHHDTVPCGVLVVERDDPAPQLEYRNGRWWRAV